MRYANDGSLTDYITNNFENLKWEDKIEYFIVLFWFKYHSSRETCTS